MARLSLSKPCTLLPLRRAVTRAPREAARYSGADQADMPPQETSGAGSGRSDRIKGPKHSWLYLFPTIQSLENWLRAWGHSHRKRATYLVFTRHLRIRLHRALPRIRLRAARLPEKVQTRNCHAETRLACD